MSQPKDKTQQPVGDAESRDSSATEMATTSEYSKILAHWIHLERGDRSEQTANSHHASVLSVD